MNGVRRSRGSLWVALAVVCSFADELGAQRRARSLRLSWMGFLTLATSGILGCARISSAEPRPADKRVHVDTVIIDERAVPRQITLTGTLEADQRTDLAANASGRVTRTFVERGQHVTAGQTVAQLDVRTAALAQAEARANAQSAESQMAQAKADCDRFDALLKHGAIPQQDYDHAMTQCQTTLALQQAAQTRVQETAQTLRDGSIRAPFAGVIAERFVSVGDFVHSDTRVVTLIESDPLRLKLSVPEANVAAAREGLVVTFETVGIAGRSFPATIRYLGREVRATTRDLVVEAVAPNPDGALLPGMFVMAHMPVGDINLPVVPKRAVYSAGGMDSVFVVVDRHLEQRIIQTGPQVGDDVAVRDGLTRGAVVVTNPSNATVDGALID